MAEHYVLEVLRARHVVWDSRFHRNLPSLYVKVNLDGEETKTRTVSKNLFPTWNEKLISQTLAASKDRDMVVKLKHRSRWRRNPCIGTGTLALGSLMEKSANGEVQLELRPTSGPDLSEVTAVVFLRIKFVSEREALEAGLDSAERDVEQAGLATPAGALGIPAKVIDADDVNPRESILESVAELLEKMKVFMDLVDRIAAIHPYLNAAWQVTSALLRVVQGQVEADEKVIGLVHVMKEIFEIINVLDSLEDKPSALQKTVVEFVKQSAECCLFIRQYTQTGFIRRMLIMENNDKINQFRERFVEIKSAITLGSALHGAFVSARISKTVDIMFLRQELNPLEMDASSRPQCLAGTRTDFLAKIMDWLFSADPSGNMLWLYGVTGSGKSTISMTIAEYFLSMSRRGAYLFFVRGKNDPSAVIRTIAFWLASFDHNIAKHITTAVESNNGIGTASLESQFEKLLLLPLQASADAMTGPVAVILDALDECGTPGDRFKLLKLLRDEFPKLPSAFRFIITSRPEADIRKCLSSLASIHAIELDYSSTVSQNDVSRYIDHELCAILEDHGMEPPSDRSWESDMNLLKKTANGLFIWASTAMKMIRLRGGDPFGALDELLTWCRSDGTGSRSSASFGLNELYDTVLTTSGISWNIDSSRQRFLRVLGLILLSKVPLSIAEIDGILGYSERSSSRFVIGRLQSVLVYIPGNNDAPVRPFHASFSDYLLSPERNGQPWCINIPGERLLQATCCFDVMERNLCFNICGIESSFVRNSDVPDIQERIKDRIPSYLQYACLFWAEHLCDVSYSDGEPELPMKLERFAKHFLLYWFEVLSLTKHFKRLAGRALLNAALWTTTSMRDVSSFLWSAYRLASIFSLPISESIPHIYLSALSLGKGDFMVADQYATAHPGIRVHRFGIKPLQPCLKAFQGDRHFVRAVAFSPDGKRVASGSDNGKIRVWDAESGEVICGPFKEHIDWVYSVAFSPDGKRIASSSRDRTIRVLDAESGELVCRPFEGHSGAVSSVAFSPDGRYVASGSADATIRVWDAESGEVVSAPFKGHNGAVSSVAYSPDGRRIASGSDDYTIRVWDALSGEPVSGPFEGPTDPVCSIAFSPDGRRIASITKDGTIHVWDAVSGEVVLGPFEGHAWTVSSVAFSLDGKRIVSGGDDGWICVRGADTGAPILGRRNSGGTVLSVVFSPDGKRITFGSLDGIIRVWDVESSEASSGPFEVQGHTSIIKSISVSPDGKKIASGSYDKTVCVWDVESGKLLSGPFRGHTECVCLVAFAPDGKKIASGSEDKSIRVWDAQSGALVSGPFEGHTRGVASVTFTTDGRHIVSSSSDGTTRIWDVESEEVVSDPLTAPSGYDFVHLSPDGKRIAGRSSFGSCIWDVETDTIILGPFEGSIETFSTDGKLIVSRSHDRTFRVWDIESGKLVAGPFGLHTSRIHSLEVTADGKLIAPGVAGMTTIIVWDAETGEIFSGPFKGHTYDILSVVFFPDKKRLASCSCDGMIRVWDLEYGRIDSSVMTEHLTDTEAQAPSVDNAEHVPYRAYKPSPERGETSLVPKEVGRDPSWNMSKTGWILGKNGELIIWVPEDIRMGLWHPSNTAVFGGQFSTKLDFSSNQLGEGWYEGYPCSKQK